MKVEVFKGDLRGRTFTQDVPPEDVVEAEIITEFKGILDRCLNMKEWWDRCLIWD